jgi:hypothetical protein
MHTIFWVRLASGPEYCVHSTFFSFLKKQKILKILWSPFFCDFFIYFFYFWDPFSPFFGGVVGGGINPVAGGYNRKKARYKPRGGRTAGPYDGRHSWARVVRKRGLTIVRALSYPYCTSLINRQYLRMKYYA